MPMPPTKQSLEEKIIKMLRKVKTEDAIEVFQNLGVYLHSRVEDHEKQTAQWKLKLPKNKEN